MKDKKNPMYGKIPWNRNVNMWRNRVKHFSKYG